jgi:hypothetical protein
MKKIMLRWWLCVWGYIPFGNLCQFWYNGMRITLQKDLYVCFDTGKGTVKDLMPVTFVSEDIGKLIEKELIKKGYEVNI